MSKKRKLLSHEEIWDDSGLVRSWDAALEEYKLYHSIHAKGERVEDVIEAFQANEDAGAEPPIGLSTSFVNGDQQPPVTSDTLEDGEWEEEEEPVIQEMAKGVNQDVSESGTHNLNTASSTHPPTSDTVMPDSIPKSVPAAMIAPVQDDALKSLMMSWYWAGYYTGLYQGQQQSATQTADTTRP